MPSIQDVADQVNAKLDQINQHTSDTVTIGNQIRGELVTANSKLDSLDTHLQAGVQNLANGLLAIWELQKVANAILGHQSDQNDTIICLLENTNEILCGMTRKMTRQLELESRLVTSLSRVEGIMERTDPAAAGDYDRLAAVQRELAACCPPPETELERCPENCPHPEMHPYKPDGQDWKPSRAGKAPG